MLQIIKARASTIQRRKNKKNLKGLEKKPYWETKVDNISAKRDQNGLDTSNK